MNYIKSLIDGKLEQFKQQIETSLYSKLSEKLDEVKIDVASDIYNEGRCVPCSQKMNEGKQRLEDMSIEDCTKSLVDSKDMKEEDAAEECRRMQRVHTQNTNRQTQK